MYTFMKRHVHVYIHAVCIMLLTYDTRTRRLYIPYFLVHDRSVTVVHGWKMEAMQNSNVRHGRLSKVCIVMVLFWTCMQPKIRSKWARRPRLVIPSQDVPTASKSMFFEIFAKKRRIFSVRHAMRTAGLLVSNGRLWNLPRERFFRQNLRKWVDASEEFNALNSLPKAASANKIKFFWITVKPFSKRTRVLPTMRT